MRRRGLFRGIVFAWVMAAAGVVMPPARGQQTPPATGEGPTSPAAHRYVVLLSLQGLRWDDPARDGAKNLLALGRHGAWAPQGMLPGYPALAWPAQFTIVTGLYPGHHGIVGDSFFDRARQASFSADNPKAAADGSWYTGTPIWSLAERAGIPTGCIGWAGCTAQIAGLRPSKLGREGESPEAEAGQIVSWLRLSQAERPQFIAAQFAEPGESARRFGPDAAQTRAAVRRMDAMVGKLKTELDATHLPIDLVVVSDRGMARTDGGWIALSQYADLSGFNTVGTLLYAKTEADRERVYNQLKKATSEYFVYRLKNVPADLDFRNDRAGDPAVVATGAYALRAHGTPAGTPDAPPPRGVDGFDARLVPEMKAIFFAAGPDIVAGRTVAPFESVNLYPWLAHLLGLTPPKTDGTLNILSGTLRDNGDETGR